MTTSEQAGPASAADQSGLVLVTGGTSGIGLGIAVALAAAGRTVAVMGRDRRRADDAVTLLRPLPGPSVAVVADTTDPVALADAVATVEADLGPVAGLVTAAGYLARGSTLELAASELRIAIETNVVGTWLAIRAVLPGMLNRRCGRIVTIGSVLGSTGAPSRGGYAATKAAVHALTRSVALDVAGTGVTVNCIAPGPVRTPMNESAQETDAAAQAAFTAKVPIGRWGTPGDVAHMATCLLDANSGFTTGSVIHVDGGYTAQ